MSTLFSFLQGHTGVCKLLLGLPALEEKSSDKASAAAALENKDNAKAEQAVGVAANSPKPKAAAAAAMNGAPHSPQALSPIRTPGKGGDSKTVHPSFLRLSVFWAIADGCACIEPVAAS